MVKPSEDTLVERWAGRARCDVDGDYERIAEVGQLTVRRLG